MQVTIGGTAENVHRLDFPGEAISFLHFEIPGRNRLHCIFPVAPTEAVLLRDGDRVTVVGVIPNLLEKLFTGSWNGGMMRCEKLVNENRHTEYVAATIPGEAL